MGIGRDDFHVELNRNFSIFLPVEIASRSGGQSETRTLISYDEFLI